MPPWNEHYRYEAREIAAATVESFGRHWLADQIRKGNQPKRLEIQVAMRALMAARGELISN